MTARGHKRDPVVLDPVSVMVKQQLRLRAQADAVDFNRLVIRYATERLLYRLSISPYRDEFVLKGALLLGAWGGALGRPTRDADFLGLRIADVDALVEIFRKIAGHSVAPDGVDFLLDHIDGVRIREDNAYEGVRIILGVLLGTTRVSVQVDIGFGDVVVPMPRDLTLPPLLDFPSPNLRTYSSESVVAEKVHAVIVLGMINSRMKDFYDLAQLAAYTTFDGAVLAEAIASTFRRRRTDIPHAVPVALTAEFWHNPQKLAQWKAFMGRNAMPEPWPALGDTVERVEALVGPVLLALSRGQSLQRIWYPDRGWAT